MTPEERRARHAASKQKWRQHSGWEHRRRAELVAAQRAAKNRPCADCGLLRHSAAMEFDHLGDKKFKISNVGGRSVERLMAEAAKCDVVCVLCHRMRSANRYSLLRKDSETAKRKRVLQERVDALKRQPCVTCGIQYEPCQMDFDHVDPSTKIEKVCQLVKRRAAAAKVMAEIAKCQLLCALCHRLKTIGVSGVD